MVPWIWISDPTISFIVVSFDEALSLTNAQFSRDIIRKDEYQELFGDIYQIRKDIDSKSMFQTTQGGFRKSTTTGKNVTGGKGIWLIVDDPQNPETAESKAESDAVIFFWTNQLYNRLTPVNLGVRILIMQRLSEKDLSEHLLKEFREDYHHICLPAELSEHVYPQELKRIYTNGYLDPKRLGPKVLAQFKKVLGSRGYSGQYAQRPAPDEGSLIKKEWFDTIGALSISRDPINSPLMFFLDSAFTEKTENDPSAILTCYKDNNILYIVDCVEVWLDFPKLIKYIKEYVMRNGYTSYSKIFVEPKASGLSIVQQLRSSTMLNVIEAPNPVLDKVTRVHGVSPIMESRRVRLVDGTYITEYLQQLSVFPNGSHDDKVDVTVMAINQLLVDGGNPDFLFI